ncbi:LegC family aminotransferase [Elusimicrobiota bacterium]
MLKIPETKKSIPLSEPQFCGNEWKYLKECIDSGWVSSVGPFVEKFEAEVARRVGSRHAVSTVNGTSALHLALKACGVQSGDEVIVSSLTFIAPVNAISYCGAKPVFMDACLQTWQMDVDKVMRFLANECELRGQECFNKKTGCRIRAILPVHLYGLSCEIGRIMELAVKYHLRVIEDACEGVGVLYQGKHVGTFGDIGVFSFNGNKVVTSGGGGILVTSDPTYAQHARYLSTQAKDDGLEYIHNAVGYNYRLTNVHAAIGLAQLESLDDALEKKRIIAQRYEEGLRDMGVITLMPKPASVAATYWLYTILLPENTSLDKRRDLVRWLHGQGVECRPTWHPAHTLPPYRDAQSFEMEHSVRIYERGLCLPSSVGLSADDQERCISAVKSAVSRIIGG